VRAALRLLKDAGGAALGLAGLTLVVVGAVGSGVRARASVEATREAIDVRLAAASLELRLSPTQRGVLRRPANGRLSSVPLPAAVEVAEERTLALGRLTGGRARGVITLVRVLPAAGPPRLHRLEIEAGGHYPGPEESALVVDRSVRDLFGLGLGDRARLRVGDQERDLPIVGVALSPEHLFAPAHPDHALPLKGTAAVVGVSEAAVEGVPRAGQTTSILLGFDPGTDAAWIEEEARRHLDVHVRESVPKAREQGRLFGDFLLTQLDLYLRTIVAGFALLGLLLLALFTARGVDRRRREVGLRLAMGQRPGAIARAFLPAPLTGVLLGAALGAWLHGPVARATAGAWARSMGFPPLVDAGTPWAAVGFAALAALATALTASVVPALALARRAPGRLLHATALQVLRPPGPLARGLGRLRERLGIAPAWALALAGVVRRRRDTLGAILGVGLSVALVLAFLAVHVSHRVEARATVKASTLAATLHFEEPRGAAAWGEAARALDGRAEPIVARRTLLARPSGPEARRLLGTGARGWLETQRLAEGRHFGADDAPEALIDVWVARKDGLAVGDALTLHPDAESPEGETLRVVGILDGMSMGRIVVPLGVAQRMYALGPLATGAFVESGLGPEELERRIQGLAGVSSHLVAGRAVDDVDAAFSGSLRVLLLALFAAVGVALLVLALLALEDRRDRAPEIALLDALGWRGGDQARVLVGEVLARGAAALGLGALLAPVLAQAFLARIESVNHYRVALHLEPWRVCAVWGVGLLLLPLAALPALLRVRRTHPARLLR
jgi:putative ABC transport system permease protein